MFRKDTRGQTLFDFVVGITLFLLVVFFAVLFIPGLLDPFETTRDANTITADRGADHLTQSVLHEPGTDPYVLNEDCTTAFFNGTPSTACPVNTNDLRLILGLNNRSHVNITITDSNDNVIDNNGVTLQIGDPTPQSQSQSQNTYTSTRIVTLNNNQYEFHYEVW